MDTVPGSLNSSETTKMYMYTYINIAVSGVCGNNIFKDGKVQP